MKKKLLISFLVLSFAQNSFSAISDEVAQSAFEIVKKACIAVFKSNFNEFKAKLKYKDKVVIKAQLKELEKKALDDLNSEAFKDKQINYLKAKFKNKSFDDFDEKLIINLAKDIINDLNCRKLLIIYTEIRSLNSTLTTF